MAQGLSRLRPLGDHGEGPYPQAGALDELSALLARLCAPNPGPLTGPGTNTYLIGARGGPLAVVDPGPDDDAHLEAILEQIDARGGSLEWVLVTHHHPDHAPLARRLAARRGARIAAMAHPRGVDPDLQVKEGTLIDVGDVMVRAMHTPGHASDHCCYLLDATGTLLAGDHLMDSVTVVIAPPDGDLVAYESSLERIATSASGVRAVAPGHGRVLREPARVVDEVLAHRRAREDRLLDVLGTEPADLDALLPLVYADLADARLVPYAKRSMWAHLRKLEGIGAVVRIGEEGVAGEHARWRRA